MVYTHVNHVMHSSEESLVWESHVSLQEGTTVQNTFQLFQDVPQWL